MSGTTKILIASRHVVSYDSEAANQPDDADITPAGLAAAELEALDSDGSYFLDLLAGAGDLTVETYTVTAIGPDGETATATSGPAATPEQSVWIGATSFDLAAAGINVDGVTFDPDAKTVTFTESALADLLAAAGA